MKDLCCSRQIYLSRRDIAIIIENKDKKYKSNIWIYCMNFVNEILSATMGE